jgi:hypothetical protein
MKTKSKYAIQVTKYWYGPAKTAHRLSEYPSTVPVLFTSVKAAQARCDQLDDTVYELEHNESSRPDYSVVEY